MTLNELLACTRNEFDENQQHERPEESFTIVQLPLSIFFLLNLSNIFQDQISLLVSQLVHKLACQLYDMIVHSVKQNRLYNYPEVKQNYTGSDAPFVRGRRQGHVKNKHGPRGCVIICIFSSVLVIPVQSLIHDKCNKGALKKGCAAAH